MISFRGLIRITGNVYGVIKHYKESMILNLLLTYWGKKGMPINFFYAPIKKSHRTRYQEHQNFKADRKGVIQDYSENIKSPISSLQNNSSAVIKSTTHRSSKSITSSNGTNISEI